MNVHKNIVCQVYRNVEMGMSSVQSDVPGLGTFHLSSEENGEPANADKAVCRICPRAARPKGLNSRTTV